jgi:predicted metal-dependent enzyme (double-stranded beta helix superfamily)
MVECAVRDPSGVLNGLGEPTRAGVFKLYNTDKLTILNLVWGPQMMLMPHNHSMWAVIGIYTGREDNIFWRKIKDDPNGRIEAAGAKALSLGETAPFGKDVIQSVTNPLPRLTAALHVYGGNFFSAHRSQWEPEYLTEQTYDVEKTCLFSKSQIRLNAV